MSSAADDADRVSTPPFEAPAASRTGRVLLVAAIVGVLSAATFLAGMLINSLLGERVSALAVMAAALLTLKIIVDRLARWASPSQGPITTSLAVAGLSPFLFLGAILNMADSPVVVSSWRCGTPRAEALMTAPIAFFLAGSLGTLIFAGVLGDGRGEAFRPLIRRVAMVLTAAAAALVLLSLFRAARKPDIDRYIDSLPVTATIPPANDLLTVPLKAPDERDFAADLPPTPLPPFPLDDITVYRACTPYSCSIAVTSAAVPQQRVEPRDLHSFGNPPDEPIRVRRDDRHHYIVLESRGRIAFGRIDVYPYEWGSRDERLFWPPMDVHVRRVADSAAPPIGWLTGGVLGVLAAVILLAVNRAGKKRLKAILSAAPGALSDNGWIHFDDGRPSARVDPSARIAPGPVLVLKDTAAPGAYRQSDLLGASQILAGTRQQWTEHADAAAAHLSAWAIATATLGAAPLVATLMAGLVI